MSTSKESLYVINKTREDDQDLSEEARERLLSQVPMGRLGTPTDVASAVLFLLGDGASYVTGTTIDVNGGMYI